MLRFTDLDNTNFNIAVGSVNLQTIMRRTVPIWLRVITQLVQETAEAKQSNFGKATRKFGRRVYNVGAGSKGTVYCVGPYVQTTAWDFSFTVPPGGFKYGDINPMTNEPFPGGTGEHGTYITLVDKPTTEGEKPKAVARSYSRKSGQTIKHVGFFSEAIRVNFGTGTTLSALGRVHLQVLANTIAKEYARGAGIVLKRTARRMGYKVELIDHPVLITIT